MNSKRCSRPLLNSLKPGLKLLKPVFALVYLKIYIYNIYESTDASKKLLVGFIVKVKSGFKPNVPTSALFLTLFRGFLTSLFPRKSSSVALLAKLDPR